MEVEGRLRAMIDVFRRECHKVIKSERVTVHGADSMLMVLQLSIAEVNKQATGEFKVALSDVLVAWRYLLSDKLHLPCDHIIRPENYDLILSAYQAFLKRSNTVDLADVHSLCGQLGVEPATAESLNPVQLFEFLSGTGDEPPLMDPPIPTTPSGQRGPGRSKMRAEVRTVFLSYLSLLVNSKDDLALARVLDVPGRALGCGAFTDLKHAARRADTSLFLAATSFVRAIQLGGKGYAPAPSDPLRKHVKGLSDFVQFVDALEEILGEVPDPSVCGGRLVAAIRAALLKGRGSEDPAYGAIDETARALRERIGEIHRQQRGGGDAIGTGISPARPRAHAINHATALGGRDAVKVLTALLDREALAPPLRNKADLLSEGTPSLVAGDDGTAVLTLFRSPQVAAGDSPEPLKKRVQSRQDLVKSKVRPAAITSQFACTYRDAEPPLNRMLDFPSGSQMPSCIHPAPKSSTSTSSSSSGSPGDAPENADRPVPPARATATAGAVLRPVGGPNGQRSNATSRNNNKNNDDKKGSKRKKPDVEPQQDSENRPPAKRPATAKNVPKNVPKGPGKKRPLMAGQGTLTGFFRL